MMKCDVIQDLMPLYEENLVSEETKREIENHVAHCQSCTTFFQNSTLSPIEVEFSEEDADAQKTFLKLKLIQEQYFVILIGLGIAVYSFLFSLNGFDSVPWILFIPFGLMLLYGDVKKIVLTVVLMTLVFAAVLEELWYGIWMLPLVLWCSGSGMWLATFKKKPWNLKRGMLLLINLMMIGTSFYLYDGLKGNPVGYLLARQHINDYITEHYDGLVELTEIHYSMKYNGYIGTVADTLDSHYTSTIIDGRYAMSNYVEFQIHENMSEEVKGMLELLMLTQSDLTRDDFRIDIHIPDLDESYRLSDHYDETLPALIDIYLNETFESETEFATVAMQLTDIIESSGLQYASIQFESFLPNGNDSYILATTKPFDSVELATQKVSIRHYSK